MRGFFLIFTLLWSGGIVLFDGILMHRLYEQYESRNYQSVPGIVTNSEVSSHNSRGGIRYRALIEYRFEVNGQEYNGNKLRFLSYSSGHGTATQLVHTHPAGSKIQVFYNPTNPHVSLLFPGIKSSDYMALLFLTPFNIVMLVLWVGVGKWRRLLSPVASGQKNVSADISLPYGDRVVAGSRAYPEPPGAMEPALDQLGHTRRRQLFVKTENIGRQRITRHSRGPVLVLIVIVAGFVWSGIKFIRAFNSNGSKKSVWLAHHHTPKHDDPEVARVLGKLPKGILNPDFCTFNSAKTSKQGGKYDLTGTTRLPIIEAGNRVNAFMKKSAQWQPYDFIKQADAVALSYTSDNIQFNYTFLLNSDAPNECWLSWHKLLNKGNH